MYINIQGGEEPADTIRIGNTINGSKKNEN